MCSCEGRDGLSPLDSSVHLACNHYRLRLNLWLRVGLNSRFCLHFSLVICLRLTLFCFSYRRGVLGLSQGPLNCRCYRQEALVFGRITDPDLRRAGAVSTVLEGDGLAVLSPDGRVQGSSHGRIGLDLRNEVELVDLADAVEVGDHVLGSLMDGVGDRREGAWVVGHEVSVSAIADVERGYCRGYSTGVDHRLCSVSESFVAIPMTYVSVGCDRYVLAPDCD